MRRIMIGLVLVFAMRPAWADDCTQHNAKVDAINDASDQYYDQKTRFAAITPRPDNGDAAFCAAAWKYRNALEDDLIASMQCSDETGESTNNFYQNMSEIVGAYHCPRQ